MNKIKEIDNWFNSLPVSNISSCREHTDAFRMAINSDLISNEGRLTIALFFNSYQEDFYGEHITDALSHYWGRLSVEDKDAVKQAYEIEKARPIAPDGYPSNLCKEDYDYVRSSAFKSWFGDWENDPEHSSKCLDEHGEPLVVYHGSNKEFDHFDMQRCGDVTGISEWEDKKTGEKINSDTKYGFFFSTIKEQAISYAFLANFYYYESLKQALDGLYPCFNSLVNYDFKSRKDVINALQLVGSVNETLHAFAEKVANNPGKRIFTELFSQMDDKEKTLLIENLNNLRQHVNKLHEQMSRGGLSNELHNCVRQSKTIRELKNNIIRLAHNDRTVANSFGTFESHSEHLMAGGNDVAYLNFDDDGRCYFAEQGQRKYLDKCNHSELVNIMNRMDDYQSRFESHLKLKDIDGYDQETYVYRCFLNTRLPLAHDYQSSAFPDMYKKTKFPTGYIAARQVRKALQDGNDCVVYKNIVDPFLSTTYGVFSPEQINIRETIQGALKAVNITTENHVNNREILVAKARRGLEKELARGLNPTPSLSQAPIHTKGK